jgi:hypothetical protein
MDAMAEERFGKSDPWLVSKTESVEAALSFGAGVNIGR